MRPKGAARCVPKPQLDPPEPKLVTNPLDPKLAKDLLDTNLAINHRGPIFRHGPPWTNISAIASGNHQRPPDQLSQTSPQPMGNSFHSFIPSVLKVAGVVHIWLYIPLCTIFAQQSNGDAFRTHIKVSKSIAHFEGGLFSSSVRQFMAAIRRLFKDPNHLYLQELGWYIIQGYSKRQFLRGIPSIQSVVKASSI
ncbi:hypothetical protein O181_127752 [Austropuccinia psidii MF-1]|uniref:Uncharacterized protein n=1 Tax=Austropuccinia psidii MF-1 TaxID=1389203 RepID=A0A9Q3Q9T3_9BASI|nr:hypothetical protein [Austropuccinia psidii MF-1]